MKFTLDWLSDHLETTATVTEITDALVNLGLEVEGVENPAERLQGFVVAQVETVERHPNADRLHLCQVNDGQGFLIQVVCGASNVRKSMKVALAKVGNIIPSTGQPLKAGVIRGIESQGMLCSAEELLLEEQSDGIIDLDITLPAGTDLAAALGLNDVVIEVSLTPNRSDCFSVRGIARDLAALGIGTLKPLKITTVQSNQPCPLKVTLTDPACPYFTGRIIENVKNGSSPGWLQKRLKSIGQRSISTIVDITNYVCIDRGRPLHAFDSDKIQGLLQVRPAYNGESLEALNDQTYGLKAGMTTVSDDSGVLALAGIMGGNSSACDETTTRIFLESAYFDPINIALTGQSLNLHSDSRTRFERGVDPQDVINGLDHATQLILECCGGEASQIIAVGQPPANTHTIHLTQKKLTNVSGNKDLTLKVAAGLLEKLGLTITDQTLDKLTVETPSWRHDLRLDVDLIEEVLRLDGYNKIESVSLPLQPPLVIVKPMDIIRKSLCQRGLDEVYTWAFTDAQTADLFGKGIELAVPLNQDMAVLRPSLLTGLLKAILTNQSKSQPNSCFFEIARQFQHHDDKMVEETLAAGVRSQQTGGRHWAVPPRPVDVFDVRADVQNAFDFLGIQGYQLESKGPDYYHPGRRGSFKQGSKILAYFGELHPSVISILGLKGPVVGFEIFVDCLPPLSSKPKVPLSLSPYQTVTRDFAFIVPADLKADALVKVVQRIDKNLIQEIQIFDVYQGDKLEADKKSIAIEIRLQALDQTLSEKELDQFSEAVIASVEKNCHGILRLHYEGRGL
jgi:phenylalanyl-tRNA synthetase beta chain